MAGSHERESPRDSKLTIEATSYLGKREQEAWINVLGARVDLTPLPDYVTADVQRNLKELGFETIIYAPKVDLKTADPISSVQYYLSQLKYRYPNWNSFETLSDREKEDRTVPRNLEEWYWEQVKIGKISFPNLNGQWMAIETLDNPAYSKDTPFARAVELSGDRNKFSWITVNSAIEKGKAKVLRQIGLSGRPADLRQLEVLEWNLAANRFGWGNMDNNEWTNTEYRGDNVFHSSRLIVGTSAARLGWGLPSVSYGRVGFRAAVVLGP